jgi:hypothetical protein
MNPFYSVGNSIGSDVRLNGSPLIKVIDDQTGVYNDCRRSFAIWFLWINDGQLTVLFDAPGSIDGYACVNGEWIVSGLFHQNVQQFKKIEDGKLVDFSDINDSSVKDVYLAKPCENQC